MHIDMDAFYASIEQLDNEELRGKPVVVGGGVRGVVSAASYEARKFGIRSAMPTGEVLRRCPHVIMVKGRMERYVELSRIVHECLNNYSPLVESASIDEAYVDATGMEKIFGTPLEMAQKIKADIYEKTKLTCSIGIAPIKFLAKIASDMNKPNGIFMITDEQMSDFLNKLLVEKVPGVGRKFHSQLTSIGIKTLADVSRLSSSFWEEKFGKAGKQLYLFAQGLDDREIVPYQDPKSESAETTLDNDTRNIDVLIKYLFVHAERVGRNLRKNNLAGRTISLKIKYSDFRQMVRQISLTNPTCSTQTIFETACGILENIKLEMPVRLIGLGVSNFDNRSQQGFLPGLNQNIENEKKRTKLDFTMDALNERYGKSTIFRGRSKI